MPHFAVKCHGSYLSILCPLRIAGADVVVQQTVEKSNSL